MLKMIKKKSPKVRTLMKKISKRLNLMMLRLSTAMALCRQLVAGPSPNKKKSQPSATPSIKKKKEMAMT